MAYVTMYPGKVNSPVTTLAEAFTIGDNHIHVADTAVFQTAENICTIGTGDEVGDAAVTYKYTGITAGTPGTLTGVTVLEGTAQSWDSGTPIYRALTDYDYEALRGNVDWYGNHGNLSGLSDDDHPQYVKHALATAANDFLVASGAGAYVKKTLAETKTILGIDTSSGDVADIVTTAENDIYVDSAATGTGDGTTWANAFTAIQDAIDSLPAIIGHDQTIKIRKGATAYAENLNISRLSSGGSIQLEGEYWFRSVNNSSKTGKIDIKSDAEGYGNRQQIAAGDTVWLMKFSGTAWDSDPTLSYRDTVASISGTTPYTEITLTTNTGVKFDTSWGFCIVKTKIADDGWSTIIVESMCPILFYGLHIAGATASLPVLDLCPSNKGVMDTCYISAGADCWCTGRFDGIVHDFYIVHSCFYSAATDDIVLGMATGRTMVDYSIIEGNGTNIGVGISTAGQSILYRCRITGVDTGVSAYGNSYIMVYKCDNDGTTPIDPTGTSDGVYIYVAS